MILPNYLKVAWLLAVTRIKRTSILATALISLVMTLTFLNLLFVRGILIGLPTGAIAANEDKYYSDIFISAKEDQKYVDKENLFETKLNTIRGISAYTKRYILNGTVAEDYEQRLNKNEKPNEIRVGILGIDINNEEKIIKLGSLLEEGYLFDRTSTNEAIIGYDLLESNGIGEARGNGTIKNVELGSTVKITINGITKKVKIVGIVRGKVSELDTRLLISQKLLQQFVSSDQYKPNEIAVKVNSDFDPKLVRTAIVSEGLLKYADVETADEYQPSFVEDLINTFSVLGDLIGSISLVVAAITIFIIIFVNALTQRKSIGILKGIGISPIAIEISYIIQALVYVLIGAIISIPFLYGFLVPYFQANPVDFPFADGVLVVETSTTISRVIIMIFTTAIAGYLPAKYIVSQNTLDAILGR